MKRRTLLAGALVALLWAAPARADTGIIVRTTGGLSALNILCAVPTVCTVVGGALDGTLGQVFLITTPLPLAQILPLLQGVTGFVGAEVDQVLNLVGLANLVPLPISSTLLSDRTLVRYPANSGTMVWNSYATQSAASIVEVQQAQSTFKVTGTGTVADIDTGVDPNHPALQGVLLPGYDFTRNQSGGSELNDLNPLNFPTYPPPSCSSATCPSAVQVNQSSAAVLDQSSAAVLDNTNNPYAAFGHGTMVMGIIHLVAPTAELMPLKAFHSDGTANLSDILRAIYYAVQNNANVINMSFDIKTASTELKNALDYVNQLGIICAASAGNDGTQETVYPAALQTDVMGVASVGSTPSTENTRSSFSNFGDAIVWVSAPGESIISTYPFNSYAAGWGTSFSAPFVSGGAALFRSVQITINESEAAAAVAHAAPLSDAGMGKGRLDLVPALQSLSPVSGSPDFGVSSAPVSTTITAGQTANYTISATPTNGFNQTVIWTCLGAPAAATCTVSPSSVTLDGTHAGTATVTLTTTARAISPPLLWPRAAPPSHRWLLPAACFAWTLVLLILCRLSRAQRFGRGLAGAAGLLAISLFVYSCGGGYGGPPGSGSTTLYSIGLNPTSVNGGSPSTGTVTLSGAAPSGGAVVSLSSSASAAAVPASVTVAAGATSATFTVTTSAVTASTPVTISASYGGTTKTASLTVNSTTAAVLSSVALNPATVNGGSPSTGTVTLSGAAPSGGAVVALSSTGSAATVPANVTVGAGATSATFTVTTSAVTAVTPVTISASYAGTTKTTLLTVNPATTGGTPAGTYTLTVTGTSGNLSHSTTVTVIVN
jgi:subtilisin family serine protease